MVASGKDSLSHDLKEMEESESVLDTDLRIVGFFVFFLYILFIYFWLHWVFVASRRLSLVAASRGYSSLWCTGFSLRWLLLFQSSGSRHAGSVVVARGL